MRFWDNSNVVKLERESYLAILRESQELRDDKKRLQADVDEFKVAAKEKDQQIAKLNERVQELTTKVAQFQHQPITRESIAARMKVPVGLLDQIDLARLGVQLDERN